MITKAVVRSVNDAGTRCTVQMPLFETASSSMPVKAEALISITPGLFNNIFVGDIVFVSFEENAIEKPIILGKLFLGTSYENNTKGGSGILDSLRVRSSAVIPSSTLFEYSPKIRKDYEKLETPKKIADYIKWLEKLLKSLIRQLYDHFKCFKNWVQWQLQPENVEVDDGNLDSGANVVEAFKYQKEGDKCEICGKDCPKNKNRTYLKLNIDEEYSDK